MPEVTVIGTTSWGITLGTVLAGCGRKVSLWARTEQEAIELAASGPNPELSNGTSFPENLTITSSIEEAMMDTKAVLLVVPSQKIRENTRVIVSHLGKNTLIISAAKGLEIGSGKRMSQVIFEEIPADYRFNICVLSGPTLSLEVMNELPAAAVVAAEKESSARQAQKLLTTPNLCIFTNTDVIGVELGGALKNIIALGAGIADGLNYGDNAKAALLTRGLTEITALGVALGANPLTFSGLAGIGDLIATCESNLSRNHHVGAELAKGRALNEIMESMEGVAEGITTTAAVKKLAGEMGLEMPITESIYRVLYEGADIRQSATELMNAEAAHELAGKKWKLFSALKSHRK